MFKLAWVASDDCYNKKTELFLSDNFYFPKGFTVSFSKNCASCSVEPLRGETFNFYEVHLKPSALGRKVTLTIASK